MALVDRKTAFTQLKAELKPCKLEATMTMLSLTNLRLIKVHKQSLTLIVAWPFNTAVQFNLVRCC